MSDSKQLAAAPIRAAILALDPSQTLSVDEVAALLAAPPKPELGDFAFPCFLLARALKQAPPAIAAKLAEQLAANPDSGFASVAALGPYINLKLDPAARTARVVSAALRAGWGSLPDGTGKTVGIDYSSPNIAKPFGIGHLRSTAIGQALANLHRTLGYRVVAINHLGDWGTQFGKLMAAFERWGDESALQADPIQHLYDLYVRFHEEAKANPALDDEGRGWFRRLEQGDPAAHAYWERFRALSLREFHRIYERLGVSFDHEWGEAFYNNMLAALVDDVKATGLTEESEGALVVKLDDLGLPPCLIIKSDGATLYSTRDLAAARYRYEQLGFEKFLYVVGHAQAVHFKQVFAVLQRMGYDWADRCIHVPFGMILGISTRKGTLVFLEDILNRGKELVREIMADREGFTDAERELVAEQVSIGAIVFYDLSRGRIKDYPFEWDAILRGLRPGEHGPTGPYLQYTHVRLRALEEKFAEKFGALPEALANEATEALHTADCAHLVALLERYPATLRQAASELEPAVISRFLLELAEGFNTFYSSGTRVLSDDEAATRARIALVVAVRRTLAHGLTLLGVPCPARM